MANKKFNELSSGTFDQAKIIAQANPISGALEKLSVMNLVSTLPLRFASDADLIVTETDRIISLVNWTSGRNVQLPDPSSLPGREIVIATNGYSGALSIPVNGADGGNTDTFDGNKTYTIISDGSNWFCVSRTQNTL